MLNKNSSVFDYAQFLEGRIKRRSKSCGNSHAWDFIHVALSGSQSICQGKCLGDLNAHFFVMMLCTDSQISECRVEILGNQIIGLVFTIENLAGAISKIIVNDPIYHISSVQDDAPPHLYLLSESRKFLDSWSSGQRLKEEVQVNGALNLMIEVHWILKINRKNFKHLQNLLNFQLDFCLTDSKQSSLTQF